MKHHLSKNSVFDDLGFDPDQAANLKIRAALVRAIEEEIVKANMTQIQAAKFLAVSQPRISDLRRGKLHLFTIDVLVNMLAKFGKSVLLVIDNRIAA